MLHLEKFAFLPEKEAELAEALTRAEVYSNPILFAEKSREYKKIQPLVVAYRACLAVQKAEEEARNLLDEEGLDAELRLLAEEQLKEALTNRQAREEAFQILLLPEDPDDDKNVILEIRAGTGGEEAALFASALFRMYQMYAEQNRLQIEVLSANATELGGYKEISCMVRGVGVWSKFKFEGGVHRVQRVPETESQGRIQTSAVTVAVLPEAEEVELVIDPADLSIDTFRSGGAGGQHINKTDSAVRITHLPTGMVVECQDERSQHKNKEKALKVLRARLLELKRREAAQNEAANRKNQVGSGDRSERIRTYNFPQNRLTDHRIGLTLYRLDGVMNGDLEELFTALATANRDELLQARQQEEESD